MMRTRARWSLAVVVVLAGACSESPTDVEVNEDAPEFAVSAGTIYYVSPSGSDKNAGTSPTKPWATINKVNSKGLNPGDQVLFQGGATFTGSLQFTSRDGGTPASPVVISSYGTGKATINSPTAEGIKVYNAGGFNISNLKFTGPGPAATKQGVSFYMDLGGNAKLAHVYIDNVEVSGFKNGIMLGSWNNNAGYIDVRITNTSVHDNVMSGVNSYAQLPYSHQSFYVGHVTAYNQLGDPQLLGAPSGSGIVLGGVDGAIIERSVAYNNGARCVSSSGPVGIWAYDANNVTIQYNESYNNTTSGSADGGGFDLDQNTKNSIIQYNYSHGNAGPGYLLAQSVNNTNHTGNIIRYNISENDGRKNSTGAVTLWGKILNTHIYNNSIYLKAAASGSPRGVYIHNSATTGLYVNNVSVRNNIIQVTNSLRMVQVTGGMLSGAKLLRFEDNNYFPTATTFKIVWGGTTHATLASWRTATTQETVGGAPVGFSVDPAFTAPGAGGTIGNADLLPTLTGYRLLSTSTMGDGGLNLNQMGISPGSKDFWGNATPQSLKYSVGAHDR